MSKSSITVLSVTGSPLDIVGEIVLSIQVLDREIEHIFYVSEKPLSFGCDVILGIDFIVQHQLTYNPASRSAVFLKPCATTAASVQNCRVSAKSANRLSQRRRKRVRFLLGTTDDPAKTLDNPLVSFDEKDAFIISDDKSYPLFASESVEIPAFSEMFVRMKLPRYMSPSDAPYFVQGHVDQSLSGIQVARAIIFLTKPYVLVRVANVTSLPILLRKNLRIAQLNPAAPSQPDSSEVGQSDPQDIPSSASVESEKTHKISAEDFELSHVPEPYRTQLRDLLMKHVGTFGTSLEDIKTTNVYEHHIELSDTTPVFKHPFRLPFAHRDIVKSEVEKLLASGIIEPAVSPYNAPIILVKKSSGGYRLVSDLRLLNQKIKDDRYPHSFATDAIDQLAGCTIFSTLDLLSSFHQIPLAPESRPYTAFTANNNHYQYANVPMGLKSSSSALNRALQIALSGLSDLDALIYVDDLLIPSCDYESHLQKLDRVLTRLGEAQFVLRPAKCTFMQKQIKYLGHIIDEHGVRPDHTKIQAIQDFLAPRQSRNSDNSWDLHISIVATSQTWLLSLRHSSS